MVSSLLVAIRLVAYCYFPRERESNQVAKIIEHVQAYYDVQEVEYGKVYKWHPENVLIECGCGELITLTASETTCKECDAEHAGLVREDLTDSHLGDETLRPWRYSRDNEDNPRLPY